jgi:protocatechuate 3,4-dioxygenase beta subunit
MTATSQVLALTIGIWSISAIAATQPITPKSTGTAAIRGRIVDAETGRPLRRARVVAEALDTDRVNHTATSDATGRYELSELTAGRYVLRAFRSGYLPVAYGQRRPLEPSRPLTIRDDQVLDRLDFSLPRMSVIAGRILDETGGVIAGARVFVLQSVYFEGQRRMVPVGSTGADDAGRYRVLGVMPGSYIVMAMVRETWPVTENRVEHVVAYAPTYYPSTNRLEEAGRVAVGIGERRTGVDVFMIPGRAANVSGHAVDSHGQPLGGETVYITQEFRGPTGPNVLDLGGGPLIAADGTFTVKNLPPGEYKLNVHAGRPGGNEDGATTVEVNGVGREGVIVTTSAGWSVSGRVSTSDGATPTFRPDQIRIVGRPETGNAQPRKAAGNPESGRVTDNWTFTVTRLFGPARLRAVLPDGWMLKAIFQGGRDITDTLVAPKYGETLSDVQVIVTDRVTNVIGRLTDNQGAALIDGTIIVFSSDAEKWAEDSRFVRAARPDQQGQFRISGLPAGDYLVTAVDYVQDGQWNDPEYLEALRRDSQRLTLGEGVTQSITLTIRNQ